MHSKDLEGGCGAFYEPDVSHTTFSTSRGGSWADLALKNASPAGKVDRVETLTLDRSERPRLIYMAKDNITRGAPATKVVRLTGSDAVVICEKVEILGESQVITLDDPAAKAYGARFVVHTHAPLICSGVETVDGETKQIKPMAVSEGCGGDVERNTEI